MKVMRSSPNYNLLLPADKFIVKKLQSQGSYGIVYLAYSHVLHQTVAVKVEKIPRSMIQAGKTVSTIQREIYNLQQLEGIDGITQILDSDCETSSNSYFVMTMLGKDLSFLQKKCGGQLSPLTAMLIALQIIPILKDIHSRGLLHRDIKPENIVLGLGQNKKKLFVIDFGTAKEFKRSTNGEHIQFQENQPFVGTYRYASRAPHFGREQGRKDDLESFGYVLVYLCLGKLPWQDLRDDIKNAVVGHKMIGDMKESIKSEVLCEGLPAFFTWYLEYVRGLNFSDNPDYDLIIAKIRQTIADCSKLENENQQEFEWTHLLTNQSYISLSQQDDRTLYQSTNLFMTNNSGFPPQSNNNNNNNNNNSEIRSQKNNNGINVAAVASVAAKKEVIKSFNKSNSLQAQATHHLNFEDHYSRNVHCGELLNQQSFKPLKFQFNQIGNHQGQDDPLSWTDELLHQTSDESQQNQQQKLIQKKPEKLKQQQSEPENCLPIQKEKAPIGQSEFQQTKIEHPNINMSYNNSNMIQLKMNPNFPTNNNPTRAQPKYQAVVDAIAENNVTLESTNSVDTNSEDRRVSMHVPKSLAVYTSKMPKFLPLDKGNSAKLTKPTQNTKISI